MKSLALLLLASFLAAVAARYSGPTNQAGFNLIKKYEGFYPNFHKGAIGYGHSCHAWWNCPVPLHGKYHVPLTQATAEALLKTDLAYPGRYEGCVANHVTYPHLNSNQYSALVSFTFTLGCPRFKSSTLLEKLNRGDVAGAANEFSRWNKENGKFSRGMVKRRNAEKALFCEGGVCGGGSTSSYSPPSGSCRGVITASKLNVRSGPRTSTLNVVGSLSRGSSVTITGRVSGTSVYGNSNWFRISSGYISAYYVNISSGNGAGWCAKN